MLHNRSMPAAPIIPVLAYADLDAAVRWLNHAFGFIEHLRIGDHRAQLTLGAGVVIAVQGAVQRGDGPEESTSAFSHNHSIMVRVPDVNAHHVRADAAGAQIVQLPTDHPYGERQYSAVDVGGHRWTFSQSIADVDPAVWGGILR